MTLPLQTEPALTLPAEDVELIARALRRDFDAHTSLGNAVDALAVGDLLSLIDGAEAVVLN